jgi:hypothetical protein
MTFQRIILAAYFNTTFFFEMEGGGIISPVLQENGSEMELDTVNEDTDLSLKHERTAQNFETHCLF